MATEVDPSASASASQLLHQNVSAATGNAHESGSGDDSNTNNTNTNTSNPKRPFLTTDKDGNQLSAKKLRRLEKNRLSARECRRRKREATEDLQRQINLLEGENLRLRLQLRIGKEAEESSVREQTKLTQEISALLQSGASEAEIFAALEAFKEKYADYGRDRRSAMEYHLRNVEHLLMPTQTTSVVMRAIQGGDKAALDSNNNNHKNNKSTITADADGASSRVSSTLQSQSPSAPPETALSPAATSISSETSSPTTASDLLEPKALFQLLVNHLDVTPAQAKALSDSRMVARELDGYLAKALKLVQELRARLAQTGENLEHAFTNVRQVLTPTQAAKFLVWVANNGAAMHMLNELWERLYNAHNQNNNNTTNGHDKLTSAASGDSSEEGAD